MINFGIKVDAHHVHVGLEQGLLHRLERVLRPGSGSRIGERGSSLRNKLAREVIFLESTCNTPPPLGQHQKYLIAIEQQKCLFSFYVCCATYNRIKLCTIFSLFFVSNLFQTYCSTIRNSVSRRCGILFYARIGTPLSEWCRLHWHCLRMQFHTCSTSLGNFRVYKQLYYNVTIFTIAKLR
jgi:hypothetical protein